MTTTLYGPLTRAATVLGLAQYSTDVLVAAEKLLRHGKKVIELERKCSDLGSAEEYDGAAFDAACGERAAAEEDAYKAMAELREALGESL